MNGEVLPYWGLPNIQSVIISIPIVTGQFTYKLDSKTTGLEDSVAIVGLSHREPVADARTVNNVTNAAADLIDATIYNGSMLRLNNKTGAKRLEMPVSNLKPRNADEWFFRMPEDNTIDLVNGKSEVFVAASAGNVTANNGKCMELVIYFVGDRKKC